MHEIKIYVHECRMNTYSLTVKSGDVFSLTSWVCYCEAAKSSSITTIGGHDTDLVARHRSCEGRGGYMGN